MVEVGLVDSLAMRALQAQAPHESTTDDASSEDDEQIGNQQEAEAELEATMPAAKARKRRLTLRLFN